MKPKRLIFKDKRGKYHPTYKVGIKLFTEPQLENIFPDYKNLLNRVENHRKNIINMGNTDRSIINTT